MSAWADKSEVIDALAAAWVAAAADLGNVTKNHTAQAGPMRYSYADLAAVLGEVRPVLAAHGLVVTQSASSGDDEVIVHTTLLHKSGQFVTAWPFRLAAGKTAQQAGSAVTYARRYALLAVLGLGAEDDDGAGAAPAEAKPRKSEPPRTKRRPPPPPGPEADEIATPPDFADPDLVDAVRSEAGALPEPQKLALRDFLKAKKLPSLRQTTTYPRVMLEVVEAELARLQAEADG
jgi:hypothetical protein